MKTNSVRIRSPLRSPVFIGGKEILLNPILNKGTAFSQDERDSLGLRGLLPPRITTPEDQCKLILGNFHQQPSDLERYIYMIGLQDRNETLFYKVIAENIEEMLPIIYTPTVGQACVEYGHILRRPRGIFITKEDRGVIARILRNWPYPDIQVIVVTDGERILGLGDLGVSGMGISVGKVSLYTACGGVDPEACLPIALDVGTENESFLNDPLYLGLKAHRLRGEAYLELLDEFVQAVQEVFPNALLQFEDFANQNAFLLLQRYRERICTFNDDIQGTGATALGGLYATMNLTKQKLKDQRFLFLGAGEAGIGIGALIVSALKEEGLQETEARQRCWFVDSKGLIIEQRKDLSDQKRRFALDYPSMLDFPSALREFKPTAIIGVSGQPGAFSKEVLETMAKLNDRPIVFALSNPTSKSECTAKEAYSYTNGRAIFASGSPFAPVQLGDKTYIPGQGNNVYIFPGVGLGAISVKAKMVSNEMFLAAARALASQVSSEELAAGRIFPALTRIKEVSLAVAEAVAEVAYDTGLATLPRPNDLRSHIQDKMYNPEYIQYL